MPHTAATTATEDDTHGDWADRLALEIAIDMQRRGTRDACGLVAARLRLVRVEGEQDGLRQATNFVNSL